MPAFINRTIPQCLVACLPLLAAGTLTATDLHVSPGGNDRHPGKPDLPAMIEALQANPDHYELTPEQLRDLKTVM